jgi:hypothetical protein
LGVSDLAVCERLLAVGLASQVGDRDQAAECSGIVDDWQPTYSRVSHDPYRILERIGGMTHPQLLAANCINYSEIRQAFTIEKCTHAYIAIRNHADDPRLPVIYAYRDAPKIVLPHEVRRALQRIRRFARVDRVCHDLLNNHLLAPSNGGIDA